MKDSYSYEECTKLGPNRLVVVARDQEPETTEAIKNSIESARHEGYVYDVEHLLLQGWFKRMNDDTVTIESVKSGKEETYPLEQIVVCLGLDILQERLDARRKREEEEGN
jgi:hypothetical protein|tara:strand:+ start:3767 stop:4096 length:330 start_codon:yes stop_codon:yes gene_type:complete